MQLLFQKVKDSRVQSRRHNQKEDLWLMVLNSIVMQVLTVLALIQVKYSKEKDARTHGKQEDYSSES